MRFEEIQKTTLIGAGTMGSGMGLCFAQAGYDVILYDISPEQLSRALERIDNSQEVFIRENIIEPSQAEQAKNRIGVTTDLDEALEDAQFVCEAVPEKLELKQQLFKEVEALCGPAPILVSNTSGLSITAIASVCDHPERIAGFHWVNPPELVPLVEVIRGEKTSDETIDLIYNLALKLGKMPVKINKEAPGIGLNRLQFAVLREAFHMIGEGIVSAEDLDRIMKYGLGFRYPWIGPLETADLGGLDVFFHVSSYLFKELSNAEKPPDSFKDLIEQGHLGIKAGRGFYEYAADARDEILRKRDLYFIRQWKLINEVKKA
jgi:3-hydroxybutyryl-CoA dehydrogenase